MALHLLLTFHHAPHFDTVLGKPFEYKRRFVLYPSETVEHKDEQNIELVSQCGFFELLDRISVIRRHAESGNALLFLFHYYRPAVSLSELSAGLSLHRNIILNDVDLLFG